MACWKKEVLLLMGLIWAYSLQAQPFTTRTLTQTQVDSLSQVLQERLAQVDTSFAWPLPPVKSRANLPANARYEKGQILIGRIQAAFATPEDVISLIYHEYQHYLHEKMGLYLLCYDSLGQIVQWDTGEMFAYQPLPEEVEISLAQVKAIPSNDLSPAEYAQLKRDLTRAQKLPFFYAPSHLAMDELRAYRAQLRGEILGLYRLSPSARVSIHIRLHQLQDTYHRRTEYEALHGLMPNGCARP